MLILTLSLTLTHISQNDTPPSNRSTVSAASASNEMMKTAEWGGMEAQQDTNEPASTEQEQFPIGQCVSFDGDDSSDENDLGETETPQKAQRAEADNASSVVAGKETLTAAETETTTTTRSESGVFPPTPGNPTIYKTSSALEPPVSNEKPSASVETPVAAEEPERPDFAKGPGEDLALLETTVDVNNNDVQHIKNKVIEPKPVDEANDIQLQAAIDDWMKSPEVKEEVIKVDFTLISCMSWECNCGFVNPNSTTVCQECCECDCCGYLNDTSRKSCQVCGVSQPPNPPTAPEVTGVATAPQEQALACATTSHKLSTLTSLEDVSQGALDVIETEPKLHDGAENLKEKEVCSTCNHTVTLPIADNAYYRKMSVHSDEGTSAEIIRQKVPKRISLPYVLILTLFVRQRHKLS